MNNGNILNKNIVFTNLPFQENVVQTRSQTEKSQISSKLWPVITSDALNGKS